MAKRKNNRNQPQAGAADTEFGAEISQSKKARKKAARESKNNR